MTQDYQLDHLDELEAESIFVLREVAAQFERPAILFSGGKDSIVVTHLATKAFAPARIPMPLVHIDTGHNFPETIEFRDGLAERLGVQLVVGSVQATIDAGRVREETGAQASRNRLQTTTLLDTVEDGKYDACVGGARRDEEKARAKERFFSHRDDFGQWDPKHQRPELWNLFNGNHMPGEHFRVFPLNNWTELDIWNYITREQIALPSLYFAHDRKCVVRDGVILAHVKEDHGLLRVEGCAAQPAVTLVEAAVAVGSGNRPAGRNGQAWHKSTYESLKASFSGGSLRGC